MTGLAAFVVTHDRERRSGNRSMRSESFRPGEIVRGRHDGLFSALRVSSDERMQPRKSFL
jgi:hypothetical protein